MTKHQITEVSQRFDITPAVAELVIAWAEQLARRTLDDMVMSVAAITDRDHLQHAVLALAAEHIAKSIGTA